MRPLDAVQVYSSFTYAVEPRSFCAGGKVHQVDVIDRVFRTPGQIHFQVRCDDDRLIDLVYEEANDRWFFEVVGEPLRVASCSTAR
jgi:hypothetical protein